MQHNFNLTIDKTKEFTEPLLIKYGCDECELDFYCPEMITITGWTSRENKKNKVIINVICGETIETGTSTISVIDLFIGTKTISKIELPKIRKDQSMWIQGKCIKDDSIEMTCTLNAPEYVTAEGIGEK